jgi:hypothetical protein
LIGFERRGREGHAEVTEGGRRDFEREDPKDAKKNRLDGFVFQDLIKACFDDPNALFVSYPVFAIFGSSR